MIKYIPLFLLYSFQIQAQIIYVDQQASGANNGTSWTDAYVDLADGFSDSSADEIWITNGSYRRLSANADSSASFVLDRSVTIRGGFQGFETDISERNAVTGATIITADVQNDDNGLDSLTRLDNDIHALYVFSGHQVTLDLLTFEGGQTENDPDINLSLRAGGGVFSTSPLNVVDCTFRENYARSGGGLYIWNMGTPSFGASRVENCLFTNNLVPTQCAGAMFNNLPEIIVSNSTFSDNMTNRGVCYPFRCLKATITDCVFENNTNPVGFSAGVFTWQSQDILLEGCEFNNNNSANAGACYFDARELPTRINYVTMRDCTFESNNCTNGNCFGGAVFFFRISFDIDNCSFNTNNSMDSAGALYAGGGDNIFEISNTSFAGNSATYGGSVVLYDRQTEGKLSNCTFIGNQASVGGGAINIGFQAAIEIENCTLEENSSSVGGSISLQNDSTSLNLIGTTFSSNSADNGGAIGMFSNANIQFNMDGGRFENNISSFGGGIFLSNHSGTPVIPFTINNVEFVNNTSNVEGAGINITNASGLLSNCLFYGNEAFSTGTGGALSINADSMDVDVILRHNTIVDNRGALSNGIALWGIGGIASCIMQNSILDNDGTRDYALEDGQGRLISQGGNFIGDFGLIDSFDLSMDIFESDPGFVARAVNNYNLDPSSPCIDQGKPEWATMNDLNGEARDGAPDIGCYEFGAVLSTDESDKELKFKVFPNPSSQFIQIEQETSRRADVYLFDSQGQWLRHYKHVDLSSKIDVYDLPSGIYHLILPSASGNKKGSFIKE